MYVLFSGMLKLLPAAAILLFLFKDKLRKSVPSTVIMYLLSFVGVLVIAYFVYYSNLFEHWQLIFITFITKNYTDITALFSLACKYILNGQFSFSSGKFDIFYIRLIEIIVTFPLVYWFIKKNFLTIVKENEDALYWKQLWILPVMYFVVYELGVSAGYGATIDIAKIELVLPCIWTAGNYLTYFIIAQMVREIQKILTIEKDLLIFNEQLNMQKKELKRIQESI